MVLSCDLATFIVLLAYVLNVSLEILLMYESTHPGLPPVALLFPSILTLS